MIGESVMSDLTSPHSITTRKASRQDIQSMVSLSSEKRSFYEKVQPQFWKRAADADKIRACTQSFVAKSFDGVHTGRAGRGVDAEGDTNADGNGKRQRNGPGDNQRHYVLNRRW